MKWLFLGNLRLGTSLIQLIRTLHEIGLIFYSQAALKTNSSLFPLPSVGLNFAKLCQLLSAQQYSLGQPDLKSSYSPLRPDLVDSLNPPHTDWMPWHLNGTKHVLCLSFINMGK